MHYALVSGGSKGIGYAIATALAKRQFNLVLIARDKEALETAKTQLEREHPVGVEILSLDVSLEHSAETVKNWCTEKKLSLKFLCNATGIGGEEDYLSVGLADSMYMFRLNTEPAMSLIFNLLPFLQKNTPAYILNVSSMAGFAPIPIKNIYSAAKSATIFFSYSLRYQLKKDGISVSCLCPGPVFTKPGIEEATVKQLGWLGKQMAVHPAEVGEIAVQKTLDGKMIIVPGTLASLMSIVIRLLPKRLLGWMYHRFGSEK
ncbi:MAG: short-chain dehydrogenase [Ferruginibacter sp.]|nr:short-chain dehydrogenase [Ferruginibacter sp.]